MIRPRARAGYKLIEMVTVMGLLAALIGFSAQVIVRLQRNADRQQIRARGGVAVEQLLSQLRADIQTAARVAAADEMLSRGPFLVLEAADGKTKIAYRWLPEENAVAREAADRRLFRLPHGAALSLQCTPSVRRARLITVTVAGAPPGFRRDTPLQATMVAALRTP